MERLCGYLPVVDADKHRPAGKSHVYSLVWTFKRDDVRSAPETALASGMERIQVEAIGFPFENELIPRLAVLHFPMGEESNVPRQRALHDITHETRAAISN
jgi:hypothetical protein